MNPSSAGANPVWRGLLIGLGAAVVLVAGALEVVSLVYHQVTTVVVTGTTPDLTTRTTTGPGAPSAALIGTIMGTGAALVLVAAFFTRITKIVLPGGAQLDLETSAAISGAIAQKTNDPAVAATMYRRAAERAASAIAEQHAVGRVPAARRQMWTGQSPLDDATIGQIVADAVPPGNGQA